MTEHGISATEKRSSTEKRSWLSIDEAARKTSLTDAQVRYYADAYRDFLGLKRDADGRWELSGAHVRFMAVLAQGGTPAQATAALRGAVWLHDDEPSLEPAHAHDPAHVHRPDLAARVDDMALYVADLAEETKQIQMLLSRIISLLDGSARPLPESVRPWEPPDLSPSSWAGDGSLT